MNNERTEFELDLFNDIDVLDKENKSLRDQSAFLENQLKNAQVEIARLKGRP
jgi:hypothetical protein